MGSVVIFLSLFLSLHALSLPPSVIPYPFGTNIHFTDPRPGEFEMLTAAGFKYIRMDFGWSGIEKQPGIYNFSNYDILSTHMDSVGLKAVFILDYTNPLYDNGLSPHTDIGRNAFAKWALASVDHFQNRGYLWEMYNEPDGNFWKPTANSTEYAALAIAVGKLIKPAFPNEIYMGPAVSWFNFPYLTHVFELGVLEVFDVVSLHPYRGGRAPETATGDFAQLRNLITQYAPKGKEFHIISSEWGYSVNYAGMDIVSQGKFLPRMFLTNLANNISLSIYYDWHDDGTNSSYSEDNFGTTYYPYYPDRVPCYDPKPNYISAQTFMTLFSGYQFDVVLATKAGDFVYQFFEESHSSYAYAVWTNSSANHSIAFTAQSGSYQTWDYLGGKHATIDLKTATSILVEASDGPFYLVSQ